MSRDIERLLERAAGAPARLDDTHNLWQKGRRRRLRDFTAIASASSLLVAGLLVYGLPFTVGDGNGPPADRSTEASDLCADDPFGCLRIGAGEAIILGTLLTLSGESADLGTDAQRGAILAAEARGNQVAGHPIEWDHRDDLCTPVGGKEGARDLALEPQVVAVVGTTCSSAGEVAAQILSESGIVIISPSNTAPSVTAPETHQPFYLRTSYNDNVQGAALAEFAIDELGAGSAATISDNSPSGETLAAEFRRSFEEAGGEVTAQGTITVGRRNFQKQLSSIATTQPDLIYFALFHDEGWRFTVQARAMSELKDVVLAGSDWVLTREWLRRAGSSAEGVYLTQPDLEFGGAAYEDNLLTPYRERWGEPTGAFHAHAYDATNLVLDAIEAVAFRDGGDTYIPRTALKNALFSTSGYRGIVGELTCNERGDCNPRPAVQVMRVKNGNLNTVWERPR
jgi:branched-chain amino acid transport system substrate-binding protein